MSVATEMMPDWKNWEGDLVDGEFSLEQFLGAGEKSAVFRTRLPSGDGAIKLVPAGGAQALLLVERWAQAGALDHPHLIGIVKTGTWVKGGMPLAYVVTEFAEENLAAVLVERALTAEETLELLPPAADALAYLHHRGLVHGDLKPSNVFAVNDTLKLSRDTVSVGDASADVRALVATAVHALTQQPLKFTGDIEIEVIQSLPKPFPEIVRNCMGSNGRVPWSAARLAGWLQEQKGVPSATPATATQASRSRTRRLTLTSFAIIAALVLVAAVTVGSWLRNRPAAAVPIAPPPTAKPIEPVPPAPPIQASPPATEPQKAPAVAIKPPAAREPRPRPVLVDPQQAAVRQVMPDIPAEARRTVRGVATVVVRVAVDQSGDVTEATLEPGGSRYFGRLALEAARKWRFVPGSAATPREWSLRFEITRADTTVLLEKLAGR
jgi:TonB family protein